MPTETLVLVVICGLCSFRVTRFITRDSLIDEARDWVVNWSYRGGMWRLKVGVLAECPWCIGVWVSLLIGCLAIGVWPWLLGVDGWVTVGAVTGVQALLNAKAE